MLDIKLIRERPDDVKARARDGRRVRRERSTSVLEADRIRREALSRARVACAPSARGARRRSARCRRRSARRRVAALQALGDRSPRPRRRRRRPRRASTSAMLEVPNLPHPTCRSAPTRPRTSSCATVGEPATLRLRAAAALGARRGARHHRLRARREDLRHALLRADGRRRAAAARADHLDARPARRASTATPRSTRRRWCARECLVGTGNLPKFGDNLYRDAEEDFWFIPTAEVPVTNLYRDEILEPGGAAGQARRLHAVLPAREDVGRPRRARHQARPPVRQGRDGEVRRARRPPTPSCARCSTTPRTSAAGSACRTAWCRCAPATSASSPRMKYDVEVWAPGCGEWLEVSSCSNFRDFQARRANIRYRPRRRRSRSSCTR